MTFLHGWREKRFIAIQNCLVPLSRDFREDEKRYSVALINGLLSRKPKKDIIRLSIFMIVIDIISLLKRLRTFRGLSPENQNQIAEFFFDSPVSLFRKGFWALNALAKFGVYAQESVYPKLHYKIRAFEHGHQ